jgi:hypothetical protein
MILLEFATTLGIEYKKCARIVLQGFFYEGGAYVTL